MLPLAVRRVLLRLGGVHLGSHIWGLDRCYFESEHVSLGNGVGVNTGCFFEGHGRILVGRDTFIGPQVMIVTSVHEFGPGGEVARQPAYRDVRIGDRCWIGARATILPGVSIGDGTVVAAAALVTKDCEPGALYGGVPARRLR
jgi:maltose O-acetyltransferase